PQFSVDGKTLYFSSDMQGGYGGMDLYKASFDGTTWGKPENLGAGVNSPANELFPAVRGADTLYYSSNGQQTLGGLDVLYSLNRNGAWSEPYHLPYPINTAADDFGVAFNQGTATGYFSSNRAGNDQIYSFVENEMSFVLKGLVTQEIGGDPIENATIIVTNLTDGTEERLTSDEVGMYEMNLLPGKEYQVRVEKDGYFASNETVSTKNKSTGEELNLNVGLLPLSNPEDTANNGGGDNNGTGNNKGDGTGKTDGNSTGGGKTGSGDNNSGNGSGDGLPSGVNSNNPYQIPNILWDYNKWDIRPDAIPYLNYVSKLLKDNPDLQVEISSHCYSRGSDFYNDELSSKRAQAVTQYLVTKGVRRAMLVSKGYGEKQLLNKCTDDVPCSEAEHQVNRRTEFKVLNK
ncbi:MAG: hypothetical protein RL226_1215, partial [Bacteroidota bacterium]